MEQFMTGCSGSQRQSMIVQGNWEKKEQIWQIWEIWSPMSDEEDNKATIKFQKWKEQGKFQS
jgi:hypothetical protein